MSDEYRVVVLSDHEYKTVDDGCGGEEREIERPRSEMRSEQLTAWAREGWTLVCVDAGYAYLRREVPRG